MRRRILVVIALLLAAAGITAFVANGGSAAIVTWLGVPSRPAAYLKESFETETATGWGVTDVPGVPWKASDEPGAKWDVTGGIGHAAVLVSGTSHNQTADGLPSMLDQEVSGRLRVDAPAPSSVGHQYLLWLRYVGPGDAYRAVIYVPTRGDQWGVRIDRILGGEVVALVERAETGLVFGRNGYVRFRFRATGTAPTVLSVRVWQDERPEPATWNATIMDASPPLQTAVQGFRLTNFVDPNQTSLPVTASWDDLLLTDGTQPASTP
jgi:hypothetical protein